MERLVRILVVVFGLAICTMILVAALAGVYALAMWIR